MKNFILCGVAALAFTLVGIENTASAQWGYGSRSYQSGPLYHGPSLHYDRTYHRDYSHWTPLRGNHSHGHYDSVPHYTPGHYDSYHRGHVHGNPRFH
jgi:hypothetical protein